MKEIIHQKSQDLEKETAAEKGDTTLRSQGKYEFNPFDSDVTLGNKSISASRIGEAYNTLTGELISDNVKIVITKSVDRSEFVKLFIKQIQLFFEIEGLEIKVFLYLAINLEIDSGKSKFDVLECCKSIGYTKPSVYRALGLLCKKGFIARTNQSYYYWVNPSIAFNGSRMSIIK